MLKEFRDFAMRGNVIDLAVGIVSGFGADSYRYALEAALARLAPAAA